MATLQASLLCRISFPFSSHKQHRFLYKLPHSFKLYPLQFHPRILSTISCNVTSLSQSNPSDADSNLNENEATPKLTSVVDGNDAECFNPLTDEGVTESENAKEEGGDGRLPIVAFFEETREGIKKAFIDFINWVPFWQQERRLAKLIAEAEANPNDVAKQTALLVEFNKHSPECVIKHFEEREGAVDSRGVVEYLRALVITNAIAEYLPNEESGKPSTLHTLLQELKQRASGNSDEPILSPGTSERQPLHVIMVEPKVSNKSHLVQDLLSTVVFIVAMGVVWVLGIVALQKYIGSLGGVGTSSVGSSTSFSPKELNKEVMPEKIAKTFKDVKGCDDAKQELEEVVEYLRNPDKFTRLGGKLPKGILLTGPPGTGKTLLAKAIAGEAGVPFFYRAGSEFEEMYVGVGARRVRSLFHAAKKKAPCIIFIDEIDAVGSTRKQWEGHTKKTLHQLLVEMDGFEQNEGIIVMAATNLPDILDPALTRPGRFDRHIVVPNPDLRGRQEILELYLQDKPLADDVDIKSIARGTPGFNGADLANLVNIAAIKAAVEGGEKLAAAQLEFAKDRIIMGTERKTMSISEESKKVSICGMSDAIGPIRIKERPSSEMQSRIDAEVVKLLREAYDRVKALLKKHEKALHALANALLEYETLSAEEIRRILLPYGEGRPPKQQEQESAEAELVLV
ncbi:ATP-dependent zinc metalloprotease FTSH 11, chloroplastic/mitochondrial-like isoform X4 [Abrus precatorius]|uniref:ATP-dependent zinc metalloprotease FTSH 11, chloroplastic/mitochondrial-like isoform X4 n=1 Tax=Abrus precatorius TaxID=3816 RepID=A0A8B8L4R9_ABRPR|nr:ATP-dependent zinc metalloprotease FTSH 11, chloroplastic/mitochondrial-like isoform X4 [Abrus precatorius]